MKILWLIFICITKNVWGTFIEEHFQRCPVECACQGSQVDCSGRELTEVPSNLPTWTEILYLQDNHISTINVDSFQGLNRLILLDLGNNLIESIPDQEFASIPQLHSLELPGNNLQSIPIGIDSFTGLRLLNLRNNKIENISESDVAQLARVEQVDLSHNTIQTWPEHPGALENNRLTKLDLSYNDLQSLQRHTFSALHNLISIRLSGNNIKRLEPDAFKGLQFLKNIDLSRNSIRVVEAISFHSLDELDSLNFAKNEIDRIQAGAFYGLLKLRSLNLASNRQSSLSDGELFGLTNLVSLDLSNNHFTHIYPLAWTYVKNLEWLSLARNRLVELPSNAFELPKLRHLSLAENTIENIHRLSLEGLDALEILDVSSNSLAICVEDGSILQNASLPSLKRLNFAENRLRVLPSNAFLKFPNLTNLDLSDNPISTIYPGAFDQIQLEVLAMNTTSLLCDCKMQWFSDWLFQSGLDKARIKTTCSYPVTLQGIDLRFIDVSNLTCANESPQAQIILHPVQTLKALIDRDTRLSCSGYGAKPLEVQWKMFEKNGRSRLLAEDSTLIFFTNYTQENQDAYSGNELAYSELRFLKITRQDEAEYQCIVKNSYGTAYSDRARLLVRQLPEFLDVPHDIVTVAGRNIGFPCRATGIPQPIISWEKDSSKTFPAAIERRMHIMQDDYSLYILNVSKADAGLYTCSAANDAGEVGVSARLEVYEISFQSHLENKRVSDGDSLKFHCSVQAEPSVSINWFHNAEMVPVNQTSRIYMYGEMSEYLVIEQARSSDSGTYSCGVTVRGITLARQSAKVHVLPSLTLSFETPVGDLNTSEALQLSTRSVQLAHEDLPNNVLFGMQSLSTGISLIFILFICSGLAWMIIHYRRTCRLRTNRFYPNIDVEQFSTLSTIASAKRDTIERYSTVHAQTQVVLLSDQ